MNEYELIKNLFSNVKDLFLSDAQIIEINNEKWGITTDDFSLKEDKFSSKTPYVLGSNLVVATLSDLYATGCTPCFYEHTITFPRSTFTKRKNLEWTKEFINGINDALKLANCKLVGGDISKGKDFKYTGIALGKQENNISRVFPNIKQNLYVTGYLGDVNEAILKFKETPKFELRKLPKCALSSIDTSSGFIDALWLLHTINPNFNIEVSNPPCKNINYLFGAGGEYELLFTTSDDELENLNENYIKIGKITPLEIKGDIYLNGIKLNAPPPDPREYKFLPFYILDVLKAAKKFKIKNHE